MSHLLNKLRKLAHAPFFVCSVALAFFPVKLATAVDDLPLAVEAAANRRQLASELSTVKADKLRTQLITQSRLQGANGELAHWYAGEMKQGDQWLSLDEVQQQAAQDDRPTEYRNIRSSILDTAADHEKLARWCQKQNLAQQARVHWLHVLRFQPRHRAALKELGLTWYEGSLIATEEIENVETQQREFQKQKKQWKAKARKLRRTLEEGAPAERQAARAEIRQIDEPAAVPALLEEFAEKGTSEEITTDRQSLLMAALGSINDPAASETLLEFAVASPRESVRYAAIHQLKDQPLHEYVPVLLSAMRMPVEASVSLNQIGSRIVTTYTYGQEGPADQHYERSEHSYRTIPGPRFSYEPVYRYLGRVPKKLIREAYDVPETFHAATWCGRRMPAHIHPARHVPAQYSPAYDQYEFVRYAHFEYPDYQHYRQRTLQQSQTQTDGVAQQIASFNQNLAKQNERIAHVLSEVTGQTLDTYPKSWWNWWSDYLDKHPDLAATGARQQLNMVLLNQEPRGLARGTWVWTLQGRQPIETVLPGDVVLAQEPETGELAYQVVLATAQPQQLDVSKIDLSDSSLHCTPGHVVWAPGAAWQRVGKLQTGDSLHSVEGDPRIEHVHQPFSIDSYDLIVEDFHTFFVGEQGVLVHDATPIAPTYVALPGFSPSVVANATRLAAAQ